MIRLRLAKQGDERGLARVYLTAAREMPSSFVAKLGYGFLLQYHRIMIRERNSVIVCAVDDRDSIVGMCTGSLDSAEHLAALRKHRLALLIYTIPALLRSPRLLFEMLQRQRGDSSFIAATGTRLEFWATAPDARSASLTLLQGWLATVKALGAMKVVFEVEREAEKPARLHRAMGAKLVEEYKTPDGRERYLMAYDFSDSGKRSG